MTFTFGVSLAMNATEAGGFSGVQSDTLKGYEIWQDWFNSQSPESRRTKWGTTFKVDLHVEDFSNFAESESNMLALFAVYEKMHRNATIDFFFGPIATPWDIQVRNYSYYELGIPFMMGTFYSCFNAPRVSNHHNFLQACVR